MLPYPLLQVRPGVAPFVAAPVRPAPTKITPVVSATVAQDASYDGPLDKAAAKIAGEKFGPVLVTGGFIALWYALNIGFNLQNKTIFNYFPYPWTVSTVHVLVGTIYCAIMYFAGFKKASFGRPVTAGEFKTIFGPASMHAIGHVAANLSFAAVAISLTHTGAYATLTRLSLRRGVTRHCDDTVTRHFLSLPPCYTILVLLLSLLTLSSPLLSFLLPPFVVVNLSPLPRAMGETSRHMSRR